MKKMDKLLIVYGPDKKMPVAVYINDLLVWDGGYYNIKFLKEKKEKWKNYSIKQNGGKKE